MEYFTSFSKQCSKWLNEINHHHFKKKGFRPISPSPRWVIPQKSILPKRYSSINDSPTSVFSTKNSPRSHSPSRDSTVKFDAKANHKMLMK